MLRTRLWMGACLILLVVGILAIDQSMAPWYPVWFATLLLTALASCWELLHLLDPSRRPSPWLCGVALSALIVGVFSSRIFGHDPWKTTAGIMAAVVLATFLFEMATFREPGLSVIRMATTVWIVGYLGLLPCFLADLRWPRPPSGDPDRQTIALALAIFVPKCCDIGAYFTGRALGRHRMTPVLSPKKTWEGAAGGLATAVIAAWAIDRSGVAIPGGLVGCVLFGISMGVAGMLGDLAESLIKRDCVKKDASQAVPGFGGVLDVVDAVIFAGPVAYLWLG